MGKTATVEENTDDTKPNELAEEKTIEDEQLEAAITAADIEAKEAEKPDDPAPAKADSEKPAAEPAAAEAEKPKQTPEGFVPVAVMTALRKENVEIKHNNANLVGQVQGLQMQGTKAPGEEDAPAPKSFDDQLGDLDQSLLDISRKVDDGEITNEDAEKQRIEIRKQERTILADMNRPPESEPAPAAEPATDLGLEEHLRELVVEYPILTQLNENQLDPLKALAYEQADRDGDPIHKGAIGTKNLRTRMAKLATQLYGEQGTPAPTDDAAANTPSVDEAEIAKRDAKLKLAQTHPVDASQLGSATDSELVSDEDALARMENMSVEEQIAYVEANPALAKRLEGL